MKAPHEDRHSTILSNNNNETMPGTSKHPTKPASFIEDLSHALGILTYILINYKFIENSVEIAWPGFGI